MVALTHALARLTVVAVSGLCLLVQVAHVDQAVDGISARVHGAAAP